MSPLPTQRALYDLSRAVGDPAALNLAFGLLLDGPFDADALERALRDWLSRHEPLRTAFHSERDALSAEIASDASLRLERGDLSTLCGCARENQLLEHFDAAVTCRIEEPPMLRARCLFIAPDRHVLLLTFNHLAVDGWALELFGREIELLYQAQLARETPALPPLPARQLDEVERARRTWSVSARAHAELARRHQEFAAVSARMVQPYGRLHLGKGVMCRRVLGFAPEALRRWKESGLRSGTTLFPALVAAVATALCRLHELPQIVLGTLVANRHNALAQRVAGAHYGGTALRIVTNAGHPGTELPIGEIVNQAAAAILDAMSHRLDMDKLAQLLGECAGAQEPLAPSCLVVTDRYPLQRLALEDITLTPIGTLLTPLARFHSDAELRMPATAHLVVFLRQFAGTAGLTVFWNPDRVHHIDALIAEISRVLAPLGGELERCAAPGSDSPGETAYLPNADGWSSVVPAVDALSPLPLTAVRSGEQALPPAATQ